MILCFLLMHTTGLVEIVDNNMYCSSHVISVCADGCRCKVCGGICSQYGTLVQVHGFSGGMLLIVHKKLVQDSCYKCKLSRVKVIDRNKAYSSMNRAWHSTLLGPASFRDHFFLFLTVESELLGNLEA